MVDSSEVQFNFNPFRLEELNDPYPLYAQMRTEASVWFSPEAGCWLITRYDEVSRLLQDTRLSSKRISGEVLPERLRAAELTPLFETVSNLILFLDQPEHTRLRSLVNKAFTPRIIAGLRTNIQEIADKLLDKKQEAGQLDVIKDFAYPLPMAVIARLLGLPPQDYTQFKKWSDDFAVLISGEAHEEQALLAKQSLEEFSSYLQDLKVALPQNQQDNLVYLLTQAEVEGQRLTHEELSTFCLFLLTAGHETTINLIGNGLLALLQHPAQFEKLKANPDLIIGAVEEMLRYDSPVQWGGRVATVDIECSGQIIRRGQAVNMCLGAANRDPEQFAHPDLFDITRISNKHVAFGYGIHFCLGAALARLEGQIAISTLLQRFPGLSLKEVALERNPLFLFRGLKALPVSLS